MKIVALVQARMGSIRFSDKVIKKINGTPLIEILLKRLSESKKIDEIILVTSKDKKNIPLINIVRALGIKCYSGSENNVLERFYKASKLYNADIIVRITGDCPLVDSILVDEFIKKFISKKIDYISNTIIPTFPDGMDIEVFNYKSLSKCYKEAKSYYDCEHVTTYIKNSKKFKTLNIINKKNLSSFRWTVDEESDFKVINKIFNYYSPDIYFNWQKIVLLETKKPSIFKDNKNLIRNEGSRISTGQKLWKRAKLIIPGGNNFLSKRSEMFLPNGWPSYFSKAKGCHVWDLDGKKFVDMSLMGVGTNILGYANNEIDKEVQKIILSSNMSSLNAPEDVYLAEKLIELHPWADMVRFARTGAEANSIAIRIARASSNRDAVAICGYHGWHDWYLSANLNNKKNLDQHLLPGLDTSGVPSKLKNLVFTFDYNNFEQLKKLVINKKIGTIKMEVERNMRPTNNFLKKVRNLATKNNIVLIFDECTSGFRETYGGLHKKYGVEPDIATFGKALGNGYSITSILGRKEIMESAQTSFISSTFWSDRIGPTAALQTLKVMKKLESWELVTNIGNIIRKKLAYLAKSKKIHIDQSGLASLNSYSIKSKRYSSIEYKTFITQEMLKSGYLASNSIYACINHSEDIIDKFFQTLDPIFDTIKECEEGRDLKDLLEFPVCHSSFKRLN